MTRLSLEIDERVLGALDRAAADAHTSIDQTVREAIELGLEQMRRKKLDDQYREAYTKQPITPAEIARNPTDPYFPDGDETW